VRKKNLQIVFFIVIVITISLFFYFDLHKWLRVEHIETVKTYFLDLNAIAPLYMVLLYILFNLAAIPRVFFTIFSGYVFGLFYGFLFAWLATLAGLIVTFISIRYLFRKKFEEKFGDKEIIGKLNKQVEKHGIFIVIFLRAIYIFPSTVLNYSFGFTKIKTGTYLLGSAIGFIPVVFVNVYAGYQIGQNLNMINEINYYYLFGIITAVTIIAFLIKNQINKRKPFDLTSLR
jgi:uncharacterized membrane protein YdjX (TVP38/TMEM64 family)